MAGASGDRRRSSRGLGRVAAALGVIVLVVVGGRALARRRESRPVTLPGTPSAIPTAAPTEMPPSPERDLPTAALRDAESPTTDADLWGVVRAPLRPFGLVERQGLIEAAQWRSDGEPPPRGGRVRLTRAADGDLWLAWPAEAGEETGT